MAIYEESRYWIIDACVLAVSLRVTTRKKTALLTRYRRKLEDLLKRVSLLYNIFYNIFPTYSSNTPLHLRRPSKTLDRCLTWLRADVKQINLPKTFVKILNVRPRRRSSTTCSPVRETGSSWPGGDYVALFMYLL